jgi:signal transduction histidine kinase
MVAVSGAMHDLTNLATAMRAYLELLETQSTLEPRQRYYLDRTKEQVENMVETVRDLRAGLPER